MKADRLVPALLALGALLYLLPLRPYGLAISDDGWWLEPVLRMQDGAILYRDVLTHYAPLPHHVYVWLFALTDPSVLAARTLMVGEIVAAALLAYRFTRRFAPPALAWLPGAVFALVPGPWHKAFFGLVSIAFFVLLARAFEKPRALRFALLGGMAGVTLGTRQDLGMAQLGIACVAAALVGVGPRLARDASIARAASHVAATLAGAGVVLVPLVGYYAAHGAFGDLLDSLFVRAAAQSEAFGPALPSLVTLGAAEGRGVALLMLVPIALLLGFGADLALRLRRRGLDADVALRGALLAYAGVTLLQAYTPVLLVRLLQSVLCIYVIATILLADAAASRGPRTQRILAFGGTAVAALYVGFVLVGVPSVRPGDLYTGSLRMRSYTTPVELLGETFYVGRVQADEMNLVRRFFADHTEPGEPIFALPFHPLYYALTGRASPIRFLSDHAHGNFIMNVAEKRAEAERLAASDVRYAIAEQAWFGGTGVEDPFRDLLATQFHPVRAYRSILIFERGARPTTPALTAILRRMTLGTPSTDDLDTLRALADVDPGDALVWKLRAALAASAGGMEEAIESQRRAAALDPFDAAPIERAAELLVQQGRLAEAAVEVQRARAIRPSPKLDELAAAIGPEAAGRADTTQGAATR